MTTDLPDETRATTSDEVAKRFPDVDPDIAAHVVAIRDRFGVHGLRDAVRLIESEIALAEEAWSHLRDDAD